MIIIVIKEDCPRANYIVEVLFKVILKVDYRICYSTQLKKLLFEFPLASVVLYLPEEETFEVEHIRVPFHPWMNSEVLIVPENIQAKNDFFEEDIFMKCFIKLTEIENYSSINLDSHHRYEEDNSEDLVPLLHQLAYDLYDLCKKHNYILPDIKVSNSLTYSLDVDRPFVFKGLPLYLNLFGVFKDVFTLNFNRLTQRYKYLLSKIDPYDEAWDKIIKHAQITNIFFLMDSAAQVDGYYPLKSNLSYDKLIQKVSANPNKNIGIHPSYNSFLNPTKIIAEKELLEQLIQKKVTISRMHFLKYKLPDTFKFLILAGMECDFTSVYYSKIGFKHGIAYPFNWFNCKENKVTDLIINPSIAMDRTFLSYLKLSPEETISKINDLKLTLLKYGGCLDILIHNGIMSDFEEWKGWSKIVE